jgi:hypothetical protein
MKHVVDKFKSFINESGDSLSDSAVRNLKIDSIKDKIKKNMENANKSLAKSQELTEKGEADKAAIETLKYRKSLAAAGLAQIDYKIFMATESLKKKQELKK